MAARGAAQQPAMPVIGFSGRSAARRARVSGCGISQGLATPALSRASNVSDRVPLGENQYDRLPALAAELVNRGCGDRCRSRPGALAAKAATATIPIVFGGDDPVKVGLVASLAGRAAMSQALTSSSLRLEPKQLELLRELVPTSHVDCRAGNPNILECRGPVARDVQAAARSSGCRSMSLRRAASARSKPRSRPLSNRVEGLVVGADPFFTVVASTRRAGGAPCDRRDLSMRANTPKRAA